MPLFFYNIRLNPYIVKELERPDAPEGISIVAGNKLAGLVEGVAYEIAPLNAPLTKAPSSSV